MTIGIIIAGIIIAVIGGFIGYGLGHSAGYSEGKENTRLAGAAPIPKAAKPVVKVAVKRGRPVGSKTSKVTKKAKKARKAR